MTYRAAPFERRVRRRKFRRKDSGMIDIVRRLRYAEYNDARLSEAADEIERLREGLKIASAAVENLQHEVAAQRSAANEHRNAAMEADLRTQAAVRGEKRALGDVERLRAVMLDFRYAHDEIEYACGGEVAMAVRAKVMARRAKIVTPNVICTPHGASTELYTKEE